MKSKLLGAALAALAFSLSCGASAAQNIYDKCNKIADNLVSGKQDFENHYIYYENCLVKNGATWLEANKNGFSIILANGRKVKFLRKTEGGLDISYGMYLPDKNIHLINNSAEDFGFTLVLDEKTGAKIELPGPLFLNGISPDANYAAVSTEVESAGGCEPNLMIVKIKGRSAEEAIPKKQLQYCTDQEKFRAQEIQKRFSADGVSWLSNSSLKINWQCSINGKVEKNYKDQTVLALNGRTWSLDHTPCNFGGSAQTSAPSGMSYGMKIVGVRGDSAAAAAGIRAGMFLLTLNGQRINKVDDARRVNVQGQKSIIKAEVLVNGQKSNFNVMPHTTTLGLDLCELSKCKP